MRGERVEVKGNTNGEGRREKPCFEMWSRAGNADTTPPMKAREGL
jgi:hypothetical protein